MKTIAKLIPFLFLLLLLGTSCSREASNPIERTYSNTGFSELEAGEQFRFDISYGPAFSIRASGEARDLNDLLLTNSGNLLRIEYSKYRLNRKIVRFTITMPSLRLLNLSGQAQAILIGFVETGTVKYTVSGQSAVWANTVSPSMDLEATGQAKIEMQGGSSANILASASGQSSILLYALTGVTSAAVSASGQSTIKVKASAQLYANASGQSRIYYQGNPGILQITESGQSRVVKE